ncbi:uncharacterized protein LOC128545839 [Mercenaria mercenaria]|uniref:uncharacterized protein LOC128545839 n=1 Tax=Mercenaria mercenaria TaxID=6596 RepID=UPI00234F8021|nr:uncharacterized protein LOC128545839 [Mercenaria mercenaria]
MDKCAKCLLMLHIAAWVLGILALFLPFWVSTDIDDGVREVEVSKKIDSGLWWKYERFEAKQSSLPESDVWWRQIFGTSLHTKGVESVSGLLVTGMVLLTASFISSIWLVCCCCCNGRQKMIAMVVDVVALFLAAICIVAGVIVYSKQVLNEYEMSENEKHLGVSFWLAAAASVVTFLTGVFLSYLACNGKQAS